ncbi:MAG: HU family DNA-binding protein [Nitrospirae bacterium]|nr:HU family DNA-binding protein [Nitrospirota bacterium]MCL5285338.1 HU family DNA-binding protein [Nitrospirota bacterium]
MKKSELVDKISQSAKINKTQANEALNAAVDAIKKALKKDTERVTLPGFGTFSTVKRKARTGRNPRTGQEIKIPAMRVPKFTAGKAFKSAIK